LARIHLFINALASVLHSRHMHWFLECIVRCKETQSVTELLEAVENFYCEVLSHQWRLDAVDAQLALFEEVNCINASTEAGSPASQRCASAFARFVEACSNQRVTAARNLEEDASHCALIASPSEKRAVLEFAKEKKLSTPEGLQRFLKVLDSIHSEVAAETQAAMRLTSHSDLCGFYGSLWRHRAFWTEQLEETWDAWEHALECLHESGEFTRLVGNKFVSTSPAFLHLRNLCYTIPADVVQEFASLAAYYELQLLGLKSPVSSPDATAKDLDLKVELSLKAYLPQEEEDIQKPGFAVSLPEKDGEAADAGLSSPYRIFTLNAWW